MPVLARLAARAFGLAALFQAALMIVVTGATLSTSARCRTVGRAALRAACCRGTVRELRDALPADHLASVMDLWEGTGALGCCWWLP
jgi:hypothetical protein